MEIKKIAKEISSYYDLTKNDSHDIYVQIDANDKNVHPKKNRKDGYEGSLHNHNPTIKAKYNHQEDQDSL